MVVSLNYDVNVITPAAKESLPSTKRSSLQSFAVL